MQLEEHLGHEQTNLYPRNFQWFASIWGYLSVEEADEASSKSVR